MLMQPVSRFAGSVVTFPERVRPVQIQKTSVCIDAFATSELQRVLDKAEPSSVVASSLVGGIAERLFVALAEAKIWTSKVAMRLDRVARDRLFRQMDVLHDVDEWDGDKPVALRSYQSLVRGILHHKINSRPALSLMPNGNILALWRDGDNKLTVEFLPDNRARWFVEFHTLDGSERATGSAPLERLRQVIEPYDAARWFDGS